GSEGSQTLLSSVIPELFSEHEDASGTDETVMSENPESVATYTDISEEDVSTTNGSNGGETVLSELSDLLSTHVVDPMQEVFGLNSSHDDIAHEEEQPTSELVSAHTDTPEEEASAANGSNGGEAVLSELSDLLSAHVIDPMQEVFGLNSSHDDTAHEEEQPTSELVSAHTDTPAEEASAANGSEWGQAILSLVTPPLFSGHTDTSEGEVSAGNGSGENPRIPSSALFSERTDTHTGENDASSEGQTILSLVTPPLFSDHADTLEGEVRVDNDSEENSRIPSSALFREHTDTRTGENDASDGEEDLGLSSLFTDHAEDLEDKNLQTTSDGLNLSSESSTDTSLDDVLASLYGNDEEPALFMNHEDSLLQLSSILSGKEPTSSASNSFLHVSEDFAPNSDLFTIQEEISKIILNTGDFYHQMSANDFEDALLKLQDFQRNAANLAIRLNEVENLANEDQSLLGQITQVRKLLQDKAQQLLDLQARVDYVSQKREREKLNSDQMGEISTDSVSALSTSQDGSNGFSIGTNYHMRAMSPQESFYHLSSLLSGKTSEPSYGSQILQQEESNPILFDIQEEVRDIHPNIGELYHQLSPAEFEDARLQLESLQGKAANLVVMLNEVEEQWQENGNEDLLEQISYVKKTLQDKAQQLLDLQIRMDHISKQREDGEKRRLEEQSLSSGQIEGSMGGTGTDDMTNQHPQIHSDALPPTEITADETAGSSISIPSVSSEESSKFAEFSTHLTALTSLFEVNLDRLGTLGDSQKASNKGLFTAKLVKFLQNNLYDQAQTLGLQTSFEKFEEEKVLSYDEALSALPHLLQFASSIQVEAVINLSTLTSYIKLLNNFLGQFVRSLNDDQAQ
ncbi:MAG: hypothetical protein K2Y08_07910, partial [Alphaproteobacteria bacterium]|nr:hypothetical protein [Alphaproteobacteria bacterium]